MDKDTFISIWGTAADLARAIGEGETTVRAWFARRSIPARYDAKIIAAAREAGRGKFGPVEMFALRQSLSADDAAPTRAAS
ncbi:hypothetical protein JI664_21345 [Rhodobacter sp. NTK016B]|uniref:carph-isopro domain-containing protein n=1 Tax=Rhodobacter sp. NTK016B TaxID=2759676 RepID=UPI001A9084BF|nr:hypothetical protein [Rhodobacter sp. NTK016B]MBN8294532.1 hypothetical protein [Rhodobacter sp. NTK016B]